MDPLFIPARIGTLDVPNRFVRSATWEGMSTPQGEITEALVDLYGGLAQGGVGLIITGHAAVAPHARHSPTMTGLWTDDQIPGWRTLARRVHRHGARVAAQLNHCGRKCLGELTPDGKAPAPSAVEDPDWETPPRAMTEEEIERVPRAFAQAAARAREAGLDAVQLHGAHGYLLGQFLSPHTNRRADRWGGSAENRLRLLLETIKAVRESVGEDFPVLAKLPCLDFVEGGMEEEEGRAACLAAAQAGLDAVEISGGIAEGGEPPGNVRMGIDRPENEAYFLPQAEKIKARCPLPVILVGGLRSLAVMRAVVAEGRADLVALCRPFIRQPDLVNRFRSGEQDCADCVSCIHCTPDPEGLHCGYLRSLEERGVLPG